MGFVNGNRVTMACYLHFRHFLSDAPDENFALPCWLTLFYTGWMVTILFGGHVGRLYSHWPIALAMSLGSYFAGSNPPGSTVGFPVLVMLQGEPSGMGRDFGLPFSPSAWSVRVFSFGAKVFGFGSLLRWALWAPCWEPPWDWCFLAIACPLYGFGNLFHSLGWLWYPSSS